MTVAQLINDTLVWCKYFAVNETIGRPEVKLLWYEAFQYVYGQAVVSNPEYFTKSQAWTGTTIPLPANFRRELALVVFDAACTSGYAKVIDITEWTRRQSNSRSKGTAASPLARKDATVFTLSGNVANGAMYYIRNFSETDLTDETQDVSVYLPLIFHSMLLSKMQELTRIRSFRVSENPTETERQMAIMQTTNKLMQRSLKPLEVIQGLTERPQSIVLQ